MARLAAHATHTGPVIYTAHGFHFFKGAKPVYWLCYYPMERFLSRYTDQQICINYEDYERAKKPSTPDIPTTFPVWVSIPREFLI